MWRLKQLQKELAEPFENEEIYTIKKENENIYLIPRKEHKFTFIWMPGLCGKASNYLALFNNPKITPLTDNTKVVLLTAPKREVSILNGQLVNSWMDMRQIEEDNKDFQQVFNYDQANDSRILINSKITEEIAILKDSRKVFIGGMSQGCAMALYTALQSDHKLGGLIGCSGFLLSNINIQNQDLPILLQHGEKDNEIPWEFAKESYQKLKSNHNLTVICSSEIGHELSLTQFIIMKQFYQNWIKNF